MTSPKFLSQRPHPSSCSLPVEVKPQSFNTSLVLRERNGPLSLQSESDYLDSFDGSFCDPTETLDDSSYEGDNEVPDLKLIRKIVTQVEFYLSDENLSRDAFLLKHVQKNKMGYVSIKLLTSFKKVKYLTRDWRKTLYALKFSDILEVNEEGTKVRRKTPIPDSLYGLPPTKLLLAWNFMVSEQKNSMEIVTSLFVPFGVISSVRILKPSRDIPCDVKKYVSRYPELAQKVCALVEYENMESAKKALEALNGKLFSTNDDDLKVIPVNGRGSHKKSVTDADEMEDSDLPDKKHLKKQNRIFERLPYNREEASFCSSSESDSTPASPVLVPRYLSALSFSSPGVSFRPLSFSSPHSSPLMARKILTQTQHGSFPLATDLGIAGYPSPGTSPEFRRRIPEQSVDSGIGSPSPWVQRRRAAAQNLRMENRQLPCSPLATNKTSVSLGLPHGILRYPHGPDGSRGFHNSIGRGKLVLRH
ncbi:la-related protein 6-like [Bombina bombina]|uniref:la-related protein 6-like n=1 Tax=Bombina bombina TaxID=8345 RepID=UPI00235A5BB9|nr:la-related protein 6-like [Bombina bombina]